MKNHTEKKNIKMWEEKFQEKFIRDLNDGSFLTLYIPATEVTAKQAKNSTIGWYLILFSIFLLLIERMREREFVFFFFVTLYESLHFWWLIFSFSIVLKPSIYRFLHNRAANFKEFSPEPQKFSFRL